MFTRVLGFWPIAIHKHNKFNKDQWLNSPINRNLLIDTYADSTSLWQVKVHPNRCILASPWKNHSMTSIDEVISNCSGVLCKHIYVQTAVTRHWINPRIIWTKNHMAPNRSQTAPASSAMASGTSHFNNQPVELKLTKQLTHKEIMPLPTTTYQLHELKVFKKKKSLVELAQGFFKGKVVLEELGVTMRKAHLMQSFQDCFSVLSLAMSFLTSFLHSLLCCRPFCRISGFQSIMQHRCQLWNPWAFSCNLWNSAAFL